MMVLVDTPVWLLALRRRAVVLGPRERLLTQALYELVRAGPVQLLVPLDKTSFRAFGTHRNSAGFEMIFVSSTMSL